MKYIIIPRLIIFDHHDTNFIFRDLEYFNEDYITDMISVFCYDERWCDKINSPIYLSGYIEDRFIIKKAKNESDIF